MLKLARERRPDASQMAQPVCICGKSLIADGSGALYWPGEKALIVADLHLEKGSAHAERGLMLPPYDTRETLRRLSNAIERYDAETVIALGDSLHDGRAAARIAKEDIATLRALQESREWIWLTGNHDPLITPLLGGHVIETLQIEGLTLRHAPAESRVTHEIAGHMHPAARISMHGASIRRPCFVGNGRRLILPAFGAFTGGLNILDEAFAPLFGSDGMSVWMLGQDALYPVAARYLCGD